MLSPWAAPGIAPAADDFAWACDDGTASVGIDVRAVAGGHEVSWTCAASVPSGATLKGYEVRYGGGANMTFGATGLSWVDDIVGNRTFADYTERCAPSGYEVRAVTKKIRGSNLYTPWRAAAADWTGAAPDYCGAGGGGGSGGGGAVSVAPTAPVTVVDAEVTTPGCEAATAAIEANPVPAWRTLWREEFAVGSLDELVATGRWTTSQPWGAATIVNGESQYYVDEDGVDRFSDWSPFGFTGGAGAAITDGSYLTIRAAPYVDAAGERAARTDPVAKHASGILTTFTDAGRLAPPVYVEVRARMPRGRGTFPAIWLLDDRLTGGNQEIDIVEYIGQSRDGSGWIGPPLFGDFGTWATIYHAYHDGRGGSVETWTNQKPGETPEWCGLAVDFTSEFHTYGLKYTSEEVVWYIDGVPVNRIVPRRGGEGEGIRVRRFPTASMYLVLNLAMDPAWFSRSTEPPCCLTDATTYDNHFLAATGNEVNLAVDYVRVSKP